MRFLISVPFPVGQSQKGEQAMLGFKLMGAGVAGLLGGGMLLLEGLKDDPDNLITGGLWKGPILMVLGVVMLVIGGRAMLTPDEEPVPPPRPSDPADT